MVSSVTPPDTSTTDAAVDEGNALRDVLGRHVVEHHEIGAAVDRLDHLLHPLALDFDAAPGPLLAGAPDGLADAEPSEVVVLHEHHLGQRPAVVHAAAGAYGRLLERAQAGERLARVPDAGATARRVGSGVDEAAGQRCDPGEVAEEVQ